MSQQLISRSPDLTRLKEDGFEVAIRHNHLVITGVPYVNSKREVRLGTLVSDLSLAGDVTIAPQNHVALFAGEHPCNKDGQPLTKIVNDTTTRAIGDGLTINYSFSSKPPEGYRDYHHKMTTYIAILVSQAQAVDPDVTAQTHRVVEAGDPDYPFHYLDSASSRAGVSAVTGKLRLGRIGIFGVGGTGAYVLDLVAKTPAAEIAIYDGDTFLQHNAFRAPGAASVETLGKLPKKVDYLHGIYSAMHRNIVPHAEHIDADSVESLGDFDFAFLCMDAGKSKEVLVEYLERKNVPFIDVGMGVELVDDALLGVLRVTTSTPDKRDHVRSNKRISFADAGVDNLYAKNIQIADLNALNAALAVIKFKKLLGFYKDLEFEHFSTYTVDGNIITNEDQP